MFLGENYSNVEGNNNIEDAEDNLNIFLSSFSLMQNLSTMDVTFTNVTYMKKKLNSMVEDGSIKRDDWEYDLLNTHIATASNYLKNSERKHDDSIKHYLAFRDFKTQVSLVQKQGGGSHV